jgi:phosphatidylglycerophosphatase A
MTRIPLLLATFGYIGYFPIAPGTVGSAAGVAIWVVLRWAGIEAAATCLGLAAALLVSGAWAASHAERDLGLKDPGPVVVDEVMGQLVTLAFAPATSTAMVAGFFLFRLFDVIKPWPAGRLEDVHGGWGIMLDDLMAGIYACAALQGLVWLLPGWLA